MRDRISGLEGQYRVPVCVDMEPVFDEVVVKVFRQGHLVLCGASAGTKC